MASPGRGARNKGHNFERQVAKIIGDELGVKCERVLLSGIRGEGDVSGLPFHIECKRQERLQLSKWIEEERVKAGGKPFVLICKQNRGPIMAVMLLEEWCDVAREYL